MCGIAGIFTTNSNAQQNNIKLENMLKTIQHRGPDNSEMWSSDNAYLGHTRLSIIDLGKRSNQPMLNPTTGDVITYNGEVYNYIELKNELGNLGHTFTTESDTEVILKAYEQWGTDCQSRFNGMWSFVIYSQRNKTIFASRDRFGIKPFVYGLTKNNALVFSSESKAILATHPEFCEINIPFMTSFIENDYFACYKQTFHTNLYNLLPGHYFVVKIGESPAQKRYWAWQASDHTPYKNKSDIHDHFKHLLTDSIKLRFRSDVEVGACMSGGMDSTTIVGLATKLFDRKIHTFSCIYPDHPTYDESSYIHDAANLFNTSALYTTPSHDDYIITMQEATYEQDGPTGGPSILSQRAVMKLASGNVKVLLDGQGADELLGGYHGYFDYSILSHARDFRNNPSPVQLMNYLRSKHQIQKRTGLKHISNLNALAKTTSAPSFLCKSIQSTSLEHHAPYPNDDLNTLLLEHMLLNIPNLLHYEDRNSMRYSLETRLPFLDYRLVEFALSLPHRYKINGSETKILLRKIAKEILPDSIFNRKDKMGFATPGHIWFAKEDNMKYFSKYFTEKNDYLQLISPQFKEFLLSAWTRLKNPSTLHTIQAGEVNALWRYITSNMHGKL